MEEYGCENCQDTGQIHGYQCEECCEHEEIDHDVCIDCGVVLEGETANRLYGEHEYYD